MLVARFGIPWTSQILLDSAFYDEELEALLQHRRLFRNGCPSCHFDRRPALYGSVQPANQWTWNQVSRSLLDTEKNGQLGSGFTRLFEPGADTGFVSTKARQQAHLAYADTLNLSGRKRTSHKVISQILSDSGSNDEEPGSRIESYAGRDRNRPNLVVLLFVDTIESSLGAVFPQIIQQAFPKLLTYPVELILVI